MSPTRYSSLAFAALLAAVGCGKSRSTPGELAGSTTFVAGGATGQDVTVENRWCVRCHGDAGRATQASDAPGISFAPPKDASGATTGAKVGAHPQHLRAGTIRAGVDCGTCHYVPSDAASHSPGVHLRGTAAARGASPTFTPGTAPAAGTCSATYCHGNFAGGAGPVDVSWTGGALTCGASCHATPPANAAHSGIASNDWAKCAACHGNTVDASGNIKIAGGRHVNGKVDGGCAGCHGDVNRADGGIAGVAYDANQTASPPVETALHSTSTVLVGAHLAHVNPTPSLAGGAQPTGGVYKPLACTECHPDDTAVTHPDNAQAQVTFVAATGADLASFVPQFTQGNGTTTATDCSTYCHNGAGSASATRPTWTGASATCASCHGFPPASHSSTLTTAAQCAGCHAGTVNADGTINIAGGLHIDGVVQGGGESAGGVACAGCHSTIVNAMNGTVVKASRHALSSDDPGFQTTINWADPLGTNAAAVRSCTNMCHDDHPHEAGGTNDHSYNVYADANARATTASTVTRAKTDFDGAAANGGLCVSCHRFGITPGGPTIDRVAYDASAHDFTAASGATWQYALHSGSFVRNCTKCHASNAEGRTPSAPATGSGTVAVHFGDNASLLAGTTSPIGAGTVCYNCHGSAAPVNGSQGDRSGVNVQSEFAKTGSNHLAAGSCLACHAPHLAKAGDHATPGNFAGPPIQGADGAKLVTNPAFWTAPAPGAFIATTIAAGTDFEATLCFRCHSAFAGTLPAGTTDVAMEFNPNNVGSYATSGTASWENLETAGGFHPVLASAGSNLGAVNLANLVTTNHSWSTTSRNTMTCTDCHGSDNVADPNGPHGSTASFILKGPNTLWNNTIALNGTNAVASFCSNCHSSTFANSRFPDHTNGNHQGATCFNCHSAVPHGGPRPGLLVAIKGVRATSPAPPPVIAGWDQSAPYFQGTAATDATKDGLYLKSYPATNTTNWSYGNCGCNNTGSH
jgi:predicted CxxxxCH...CXXCH cytochrome family protein